VEAKSGAKEWEVVTKQWPRSKAKEASEQSSSPNCIFSQECEKECIVKRHTSLACEERVDNSASVLLDPPRVIQKRQIRAI
jgi:hypothetical protein